MAGFPVAATCNGCGSVTTAAYSAASGDVLVAVVSVANGTSAPTISVSGGPASWTLGCTTLTSNGFGRVAVYYAVLSGALTGVTTTATVSMGGGVLLSVLRLSGSNGSVGACVTDATSGPFSLGGTGASTGGMFVGGGQNWDAAAATTLNAGSTKASEYLSPSSDTHLSFYRASLTSGVAFTVSVSAGVGATAAAGATGLEVQSSGGGTPPPTPTARGGMQGHWGEG